MTDEGQKRNDPGDVFRESVRAFAGVVGAFKEAIEQTFDDLSKRGDLSPERARESAGEAVKRAQEAFDEMRGRVDFVTKKEFDALRREVSELRAQLDTHATHGGHPHHHDEAGAAAGTGGDGGDGSPGL